MTYKTSPQARAFVAIQRTADRLAAETAQLLKSADLSPNQYNVLRILRGAPEGLPCGEIGDRMITRDPDITRLVDRLEKRELVTRSRENHDRRVITVRITDSGLTAVNALDGPVNELHERQFASFGECDLEQLMDLLARISARDGT